MEGSSIQRAGDVAEAKWDASGAHVRKRARLKKKGSMKRAAHECMSTRALGFSSHQAPTQSAHQTHRVNGLCGVSGVGSHLMLPVVRGRGMERRPSTGQRWRRGVPSALGSGVGRAGWLVGMIPERFVLEQARSR